MNEYLVLVKHITCITTAIKCATGAFICFVRQSESYICTRVAKPDNINNDICIRKFYLVWNCIHTKRNRQRDGL